MFKLRCKKIITILHQIGISVVFIPIPALVKDKKQAAARRLHACRTLILDVIVMLICHHVASQRIQDFLEAFSCLSDIK